MIFDIITIIIVLAAIAASVIMVYKSFKQNSKRQGKCDRNCSC